MPYFGTELQSAKNIREIHSRTTLQLLYTKNGQKVALNPKNDKILKSSQLCNVVNFAQSLYSKLKSIYACSTLGYRVLTKHFTKPEVVCVSQVLYFPATKSWPAQKILLSWKSFDLLSFFFLIYPFLQCRTNAGYFKALCLLFSKH